MVKPSAVLTCLEDSPPLLDRRLVLAYLRTVYRVLDPAFDLRIGSLPREVEHWLLERQIGTFAFLTAYNPGSQRTPDAVNDRQNALLYEALRLCMPNAPRPAVHLSEASDWPPEKSWWAPGLSASDAVKLGKQFGQNALVFWESGGAVALWWL